VSTATDEQVEIDVDTSSEVVCGLFEGCTNLAMWVAVNTCSAKHTAPSCDEHHKILLAQIPTACITGKSFLCRICGELMPCPHITWRPL
jgi:hypothetical protein